MTDAASVWTTIILSILVVVGIVGNTLVCVVMMKYRDMRYAIQYRRDVEFKVEFGMDLFLDNIYFH